LIGELRDIGLLLCMLYGHAHNPPVLVKLHQNILIEVASLDDPLVAEIDKKRIGIGKVLNLHFPPLPHLLIRPWVCRKYWVNLMKS